MSQKSVFDVARLNNQTSNTIRKEDDNQGVTSKDLEKTYLYKAAKYHNKNHQLLKKMMASGKSCPPGYEKYLQPFKQ